MFEHPLFEGEYRDYTWCLDCERVQRTQDWAAKNWHKCPTRGCGGNAIDTRPWEELQQLFLVYPAVPEVGELYPLYPSGERVA